MWQAAMRAWVGHRWIQGDRIKAGGEHGLDDLEKRPKSTSAPRDRRISRSPLVAAAGPSNPDPRHNPWPAFVVRAQSAELPPLSRIAPETLLADARFR